MLLGETVDTNSAWLSRQLAAMGVRVVRRVTVEDDEGAIRHAVGEALGSVDVVMVSGGLGPTPDDVTRDAVAALLDRPLRVDPVLRSALDERFRARGYDAMPETNLCQAQVPKDALVLGNPIGTAPALALEVGDRTVILCPGVPRELRSIFEELAEPYLLAFLEGRLRPIRSCMIHTTGIPESELAQLLAGREAEQPPDADLAFLPEMAGVSLRLTARGIEDLAESERVLDQAEATIAPFVAPYRFHAESGDLVEAVAEALTRRGKTVATAESCTGGGVAKRLTDRAGSSAYFLGGVVSYANEAKVSALGVDPELIAARGAVSPEVAEAMARGAAERFGADAGIGVTGVAGPSGGTETKPVGTVWYAVSLDDRTVVRNERFGGDRSFVRVRAGQAALMLLLRMLEGSA